MARSTATTTGPHVAVLAFPFGTHAAPLFSIVRHLATISPITNFSFFSTPESNAAVFSNAPPNLKSYDVSDGVPDGYVFQKKHQENIELFMNAAPENFRKGMEAATAESGRRVSCLMTDAFFWFAAEMAEEMGVSWVPFWTAGPHSICTHLYTDFIRDTMWLTGIEGREEEHLEFIPGMSKVLVRDLQEGILVGDLQSVFSQMLHKMAQKLPLSSAMFMNSFEELDPAVTNTLKSKLNLVLDIGPFNLLSPPPPTTTGTTAEVATAADAGGCLSWLDAQKLPPSSVAYISFGSVTMPPPHEIAALADALETTKIPFVWSIRENSRAHLPKEFLEKPNNGEQNGILVEWAPQKEVLGHPSVGVFITHCGWNSVLESIVGGVPMICRPFFGDQRLNGRMAQDLLEIGVIVDGGTFTKNGLINSLDLVLKHERGREMRQNITRLKQLAHKATGPEGSSHKNFKALQDLVTKV